MRYRVCLLLGLGALLAGWAPRAWGDTTTPAAAEDKLTDYHGKGQITINMGSEHSAQPLSLSLHMDQTYLKPGTILLSITLDGAGLTQTFLTEGDVEESYNPVQGLIIEKRFKNIDKSAINPLTALQASMYDIGRKVQKSSSRRSVGSETQLGYACDIVELDSKDLLQDVATNGLLGGQMGSGLRSGHTKVWVLHDYGLPVRLELYAGAEKPMMTFAFTELKVNAGVTRGDLSLGAPSGTRKISLTADLAEPGWEAKLESELRDRVKDALRDQSGQKPAAGP